MEKQKKTYTPPTVTDHGKVTTKTEGMVSTSYETYGHRSSGVDVDVFTIPAD